MTYKGKTNWVNNEIVKAADMNRIEQGISDVDAELEDMQTALDKKVDDSQVLTNVPANAKFTDTIYTHPETHPASMITDLPTGKKAARFVVGTSAAGWTAADCDYLCDGIADQMEINAAITALPAIGGEIVILDGTYNITAKIDVTKDNVSIRGNGEATILKRMFDSSAVEGVITLNRISGCKISNLQIDGNKTSYKSNTNSGIYLYGSGNNIITGNIFENNTNNGIDLYGSRNIIIGNICRNNINQGIFFSSASNCTITGNICRNNGSGVHLYESNSITIIGNACDENNNRGIYLADSSDNTISGNTCDSNTNNGIYLAASSNNTISGNTCYNNKVGIYLADSSNNTITGNSFIRGSGLSSHYQAYHYTILLEFTSNNYNLISNNNCLGKAVVNGGGTGNTLVNNKFDRI